MDFQYTVNDYLLMCRFAKFYPQNPYETFTGMCIASDNPQDTFKQMQKLSPNLKSPLKALVPSNRYFTFYDGALFSKDMTSLLSYPAGSLREEWTIPSSVKRLECGSISLAYNLKTLTVLQMPEYIGEVAINDYHELQISYNGSLYTPDEFCALYKSMRS